MEILALLMLSSGELGSPEQDSDKEDHEMDNLNGL